MRQTVPSVLVLLMSSAGCLGEAPTEPQELAGTASRDPSGATEYADGCETGLTSGPAVNTENGRCTRDGGGQRYVEWCAGGKTYRKDCEQTAGSACLPVGYAFDDGGAAVEIYDCADVATYRPPIVPAPLGYAGASSEVACVDRYGYAVDGSFCLEDLLGACSDGRFLGWASCAEGGLVCEAVSASEARCASEAPDVEEEPTYEPLCGEITYAGTCSDEDGDGLADTLLWCDEGSLAIVACDCFVEDGEAYCL